MKQVIYFKKMIFLFICCVALSCTKSNIRNLSKDDKSHDRNGWFLKRAAQFDMSLAEAEKRDLALSESHPPEYEDEAIKKEAAVLWRDLCSLCHGANGDPKDSLIVEPKPKKFGTLGMKMGFTFGGDKMRSGIYRVIRDGKGERMPAFGKQLAREQMWALVKYIERL